MKFYLNLKLTWVVETVKWLPVDRVGFNYFPYACFFVTNLMAILYNRCLWIIMLGMGNRECSIEYTLCIRIICFNQVSTKTKQSNIFLFCYSYNSYNEPSLIFECAVSASHEEPAIQLSLMYYIIYFLIYLTVFYCVYFYFFVSKK